MDVTLSEVIVWLIVGGLAGSWAGKIVTFKKEGLGRWTNLGVGLIGAMLGGLVFNLFNIDLGLGNVTISFEDLFSALIGSLVVIFAWWGFKKSRAKN